MVGVFEMSATMVKGRKARAVVARAVICLVLWVLVRVRS